MTVRALLLRGAMADLAATVPYLIHSKSYCAQRFGVLIADLDVKYFSVD